MNNSNLPEKIVGKIKLICQKNKKDFNYELQDAIDNGYVPEEKMYKDPEGQFCQWVKKYKYLQLNTVLEQNLSNRDINRIQESIDYFSRKEYHLSGELAKTGEIYRQKMILFSYEYLD